MFTGLIESMGTITSVTRSGSTVRLNVKPDMTDVWAPIGASVAIDGSCLTVEGYTGTELVFAAVKETLIRTTLHNVTPGRKINLERALKLGDRLDGHLVLGHVDGTGKIISDREVGGSVLRTISIPQELDLYMAEKGSVAIDGISLTIAYSGTCQITISLIPHTMKHSTMSIKKSGDEVNIECDVLARYLKRISSTVASAGSEVNDPGQSLLTTMERAGF